MKNQPLMHVVLPRLARPLYRQLKKYRAGELNEEQFTKSFDLLLRNQHAWLARRGVPDALAAMVIHGAVLVLSAPGLRAEAAESCLPLEVVEFRAVREAARDVARNFEIEESKAMHIISTIVARYGE